LLLAFDCRKPTSSSAVRLMLTGLDEVIIGRGAPRSWTRSGRALELRINDFEISRHHVRLARTADGWELIDLGSKNGTTINGVPSTRTVLVDGDVIELGAVMVMYRDASRGSRDATDLDISSMAALPAALRTVSLDVEHRVGALVKIAPSMVPVLIRGETGTGKELAARAIHDLSGRRGSFVAVNCGALPRTLVESELFGSKRGAFSGAQDDREGLVRRADGGTLFLDEIAELPEESQVALLRVLQEGEVRPLGAAQPIRVDVRVVAATHQDLEARIADGRFRQDLYGRLVGHIVMLPPLRARREDIGPLICTILDRITAKPSGLTVQPKAARALFTYGYPLNIRELEQALRTAVVLADGHEIRLEHLPEAIRTSRPSPPDLRPEDQALRDRLALSPALRSEDQALRDRLALSPEDQALCDRLSELLRDHHGNVAAVGRSFGKAPMQIRRWCRRFGIELEAFRG
jgi:DNA-binding NtrC family response regulator